MNIQYQLIKINVPQFAIIKDEEPQNALRVEYEINFSIGEPIETIKNLIRFTYYDGESLIMKLDVECYYKIKPESWESMKDGNGKIKIPKGFSQNLASISIGTARGIQYAKTETSNLNDLLIPLLDVSELVTDDMYVDTSE